MNIELKGLVNFFLLYTLAIGNLVLGLYVDSAESVTFYNKEVV